jgi:hypothetical protein
LSYDVYVKKLLIEKILDNINDKDAAGKKDGKSGKKRNKD